MRELALADSVPVHDDPVGLVAPRALVEHHQVLLNLEKSTFAFSTFTKSWHQDSHHCRQILNDLLPMLLDAHSSRIPWQNVL